MTPTSAPDLPDIDKVLQMTKDMELISDFLTNGRFVGDRVYVSIEHLAECIRNTRPQSDASAEALRTDMLDFPTAWKIQKNIGESLKHHEKCSSVPGHDPISGAGFLCDCGAIENYWMGQRDRAALATPVGWMPIESAPKDGTRILVYPVYVRRYGRGERVTALVYWHTPANPRYEGSWIGMGKTVRPTHWMPLPAPQHTEGR